MSRDIMGPLVGEPEIDIEITSSGHRAYVEPGDDGIVTVTGIVIAEIPWAPNIQYLVVQLQADAGGWPVTVPPALTFSKAQNQQSFTLSTMVPIESSPDESRDLVISGTWQYSPGTQGGNIAPEYVHIEIMPYVSLDVDWDAGNTTIYIGETETIDVEIINRGTMTADVTLVFRSDSGEIDLELSETKLEIKPHQRETIEVKFGQSSGSPGFHKITFSADDPQNSRYGPYEKTFTLFTKEKTFSVKSIPFLVPGAVVLGILILVVIIFVFIRKRKKKPKFENFPDTI